MLGNMAHARLYTKPVIIIVYNYNKDYIQTSVYLYKLKFLHNFCLSGMLPLFVDF